MRRSVNNTICLVSPHPLFHSFPIDAFLLIPLPILHIIQKKSTRSGRRTVPNSEASSSCPRRNTEEL
uniref:Serpentine receptor class gamma n=1 Tax=Caenorhabditis tropicalis TaxID=1561998 RepID=A0A1I7TU73_9PELO